MADNVPQIMSSLAGIRSGLSLISENRDTINELVEKGEAIKKKIYDRKQEYNRYLSNCYDLEENTDDLKRDIEKANNRIEGLKYRIAETEKELKVAEEQTDPKVLVIKDKQFKKKARDAGKKRRKATKVDFFPCEVSTGIKAILIIAAIAGFIYYAISSMTEAHVIPENISKIVYIALIAANFVFPLICTILYLKERRYNYSRGYCEVYNKLVNNIVDRPRELRREIWSLENELDSEKNTVAELTEQYNQNLLKLKKSNASSSDNEKHVNAFIEKAKYDIGLINDQIKIVRKNSVAIKQALVESYKDVISPADWKHIDVIMYYLETHRADSIKEALNIIDTKLQFEQLANIVVSSSQAVCTYIQQGFIKINNNLTESHNIIMDKLGEIEYKVDTNSNLIGATAQVLAAGLDRQASQMKLNNALVKKAHKQIGELIEDMEFTTQVNVTVKP